MNTQVLGTTISHKYGVTEKKKAELDALNNQVLDAQNEVEQLEAIVNSLTSKTAKFNGYLALATERKDKAIATKKELDALVLKIKALRRNSEVAFDEMVLADEKMKLLAKQVKALIDQLIYSAEVIDKFNNLVIRKKALNPLISDELVDMVNKAGSDANNAVALTMVALKAVFAAQSVSMESEAAAALEYNQAIKLDEIITGTDPQGNPATNRDRSLVALVEDDVKRAKQRYDYYTIADKEATDELSNAQAKLARAQIKLKSLQSGLAAANAAALAS